MKNPALSPDYKHPDTGATDNPKPPSETTFKIVKKESVKWLTVGILALIAAGLIALGRSQVNDTLKDYQTKKEAEHDRREWQARAQELQNECDAHARQVEDMKTIIIGLDKKVDHLTFTVEWMNQHQPRSGSPKDQP